MNYQTLFACRGRAGHIAHARQKVQQEGKQALVRDDTLYRNYTVIGERNDAVDGKIASNLD